ncbi:MAG: hypothetical protein U1E65_17195 [Myxococcota bacterium]
MSTSWTPPAFARHRVLKRLASGPDIDVFEAIEEPARTKRHRVIKALRRGARPEAFARLLDDARILQVADERFGALIDVDLAGEGAYLVLEMPSGVTAAELVSRSGMSLTAALAIALEAAHAASDLVLAAEGVAHVGAFIAAALEPRNVFILPSGSLRFIDLSAAPAADFQNRDPGASAEWQKTIAVGCLLHYLLAGRSALSVSGHPNLDPNLSSDLRAIVGRLVERDRGRVPAALSGLIWRALAPRLSIDTRSVLRAAYDAPELPRPEPSAGHKVGDLVSDLFREDLLSGIATPDADTFEEKTARFEADFAEEKTQGFGDPVVVEEDPTLVP